MADDSSNAKVEEVVVETVRTLDVENPGAEEGKRDISILDEIAEEAKKLLHRSKSSSSSSSDSDDEKKEKEKEKEKEKDDTKEEKAKHSFAEKLGIQGLVVNVEEKFKSTFDDDKKEMIHGLVSNVEEKLKSAFKHDHHKKESGENVGEASNDKKAVVSEAPIENNAESCEIPDETTPNTTPVVPVTSASLQESSTWKSCCGLIEVLRPSQR